MGKDVPPPINHNSEIILSAQGLLDSPLAGDVLVERVQSLSISPSAESVLILGHGVGSDLHDQQWKVRLKVLAKGLERLGAFQAVRVETLREDWEDKRVAAEKLLKHLKIE